MKIMTKEELLEELRDHFKDKEVFSIPDGRSLDLIGIVIIEMRFDGKEWVKISAEKYFDLRSFICIDGVKKELESKINAYWSKHHD